MMLRRSSNYLGIPLKGLLVKKTARIVAPDVLPKQTNKESWRAKDKKSKEEKRRHHWMWGRV